MAGGKKKEELFLEEKLERALVPVEEQPYEVPGNWCWVTVGNIVDLHRGVSYKKNEGHSVKGENDCLVMRGGNILEGTIDTDAENIYVDKSLIKSEQYLQENDIIIVSSTGSKKVIGRAGISFAGYSDVSFGAFLTLVRPKEHLCKRYVDYYFQSQIYRERIRSLASGVNINNIRAEYIINSPIPLPPIKEQQRIVEQIESSFAKLDGVEKTLEIILNKMKTRRMSILYKAFQGELTAQWRRDNNVDLDTWKDKRLDEVCKSIFDGDHMPPPKSESGIHFLVISNVNTGYLSFENTRYVPKEYYDNLTVTRKPEKGDILYTLVGSYGIPVVVDSDIPFCFQRHMGLLKPDRIDTFFLWYQMQSHEFYNKVTDIANGTAQLTVPIKELRKLKVSCPSEGEQKEIVRILNDLLKKENEMRQIIESVTNRVSLLKKSILAKAFRGELGTNNPEEESAIELLKTVLAETQNGVSCP